MKLAYATSICIPFSHRVLVALCPDSHFQSNENPDEGSDRNCRRQ